MMDAIRRFGLMMLAWLPLPWLLVAWETWGGSASMPVLALIVVSVLVTALALWMMILLLRDGAGNAMTVTVVEVSSYGWPKGAWALYAAPYATVMVVGVFGMLLTGARPAGPLDPAIGIVALAFSLMVMSICTLIVGFTALNPMLILFGYRPWSITATFRVVDPGHVHTIHMTVMARTRPVPGGRIGTGDDIPFTPAGERVRYVIA